jgi:DNA repair photolyase
MERLSEAGIPVGVMVAPIIPAINDSEIETILTRARAAGATEAGYVMLRLPNEVRDLFSEWLLQRSPEKFRHVLSLLSSMREGKAYDATYGNRMTGVGPYAWMTGRRFEQAALRLGYEKKGFKLRCDLFTPPPRQGEQLSLF